MFLLIVSFKKFNIVLFGTKYGYLHVCYVRQICLTRTGHNVELGEFSPNIPSQQRVKRAVTENLRIPVLR